MPSGGTRVTDEGLLSFGALPNLRRLSLFDTQVSDAGLTRLTGHTRLETVLTTKSRVTRSGDTPKGVASRSLLGRLTRLS